jgi:hypothetical protein
MFRVHCPICQKNLEVRDLAEWPNFPFCSERCRIIDLGRWLGEQYRVSASPAEEPEDISAEELIP